ncbi:unnamed protein product [Clonostachys byssicola]|uniref:Gfd2/YDR514C-like C-terminal domain-containing protein n=1 Tax=Clonostachys byssicola TaxID=160290 RepID=A0A9N9UL70_9HYPO|nr:unnamed protein product [Clonostachys byssicola]
MVHKSVKSRVRELGTSDEGLHVLRAALGLEGDWTGPNRPILLAIDFEHTKNFVTGFIHGEEGQVGLATLDTEELHTTLPEELISTHNLILGPSDYTSKVSGNVLFGTKAIIEPAQVLKEIQSLIPRDRDIILMGHGVHTELDILVRLGFTFSPRITIIDTLEVAKKAVKCHKYELKVVLRTLCCPHVKVHTAGNDANFTLRAALLLVAHKFTNQHHPTIDILRSVAMEPLAPLIEAEARAARRLEKKIADLNRGKDQARSRTPGQIAELRAQRAAKKAEPEVDAWNTSYRRLRRAEAMNM